MKQIVEGGRKRAEVEWAGGLVRFDTDFIDAYDRHGQVTWRTGWADLRRARADTGLRLGPMIILEDVDGQILRVPGGPVVWAAVRFLLPSSAEVMAADRRSKLTDFVPSVIMNILGFAMVLAAARLGGSDSTMSFSGQVNLLFFGLILAAVGTSFVFLSKKRPNPVRKAAPSANEVLWLHGILDEGELWFRPVNPMRLLRAILGILIFAVFVGVSLALNPYLTGGYSLDRVLALAGGALAMVSMVWLIQRPPDGSVLRIRGGEVSILLSGQPHPSVMTHCSQDEYKAQVAGRMIRVMLSSYQWDPDFAAQREMDP